MIKYCLIGIICIVIGCFCYLKPDLVYELAEEWKSDSSGDPSEAYIKKVKSIGSALIFFGIAEIILSILFL